MDEQQAVLRAERPSPVKSLWLHEEGTAEPYMHIIDGECDCKACEGKIRRIIFPCAA